MGMRMEAGPYRELTAVVRERDMACRKAYQDHMLCDVPTWGVEVHHVQARAAGKNDREDNLISLSYAQHRYEYHGDNAEIKKAAQERARAYLTCEEVAAWREKNAERISEIYSKAREAELRKRAKKHAVHAKYDPPESVWPTFRKRMAGCFVME